MEPTRRSSRGYWSTRGPRPAARGPRSASPNRPIRERFAPILADLLETAPGLAPAIVGQGLSRVIGTPSWNAFPSGC